MKFDTSVTVSVAATLLHFALQSTAHAQATQAPLKEATVAAVTSTASPARPDARANAVAAQAADASRQDTDPKLNGSVGDVPAKPSSK